MSARIDPEIVQDFLFQRKLELLKKSNEIQQQIAMIAGAIEMYKEQDKDS